jgi:hypothetical protein
MPARVSYLTRLGGYGDTAIDQAGAHIRNPPRRRPALVKDDPDRFGQGPAKGR